MQDFMFCAPTQIFFGRTALNNLAASIKKYGNRVLLVYGGGSIKRNGIYDQVVKIFNDNDIFFMELGGVKPNPGMILVREGVKMCRENDLQMVLAVGGGSAIDTAKAVATAVHYDGDVSELIGQDYRGVVLPILTVLTMSGSGTEMTTTSVLNNEETKIKRGFHGPDIRPRVSFLNPEFTYTAPSYQTAAGIADGLSHSFESYFSNIRGAHLQAKFGEAIIDTLFKYGETAVKEPENYEARANVMYANTWACNGCIVKGNYVYWTTHIIEHQMAAIDDRITHGAALAVITPPWMRWALNENTLFRYVDLGVNVLGIDRNLPGMEIANRVIAYTEDFLFNKLGLPSKLSEVGVDEEMIQEVARRCEQVMPPEIQKIMFKPVTRQDVLDILHSCM